MSDGPSGVSGGVINIVPLIRQRQAQACKHAYVEVDDDAASLTCSACGAELDPWWFLRRMAHDEVRFRAYYAELDNEGKALIAKHNAYLASANEAILRLNNEIGALVATKNRLWNESINGVPLGSLARRRRRRPAP